MTPSLLSRIAPLATVCMLGLAAPAVAQAPQGAVVIASDEALQWCLAAQRSRDGGFDEVWLAPCTSPAARFTVDGRTGRVRSASRPNLCLSDTTGAGDAPFAAILRPCDDTSFGNFYLYDRGTRQLASIEADTGRRSRDSLCSYMVPRGQRTQVMNDLCNGRRVSSAQSTFVVAPVASVAADAPPPQDPRPAAPAPMAPPPVAADRAPGRSVDCLVVIDGRTYIDGPCEFRSEAGGDFTISSGSRKARVMVDPGSRAGRASFEDSSPRNPQSLVWDVTRQGACWVDRSSRICAWSTGQRPQADGGGQGGFAQAPARSPQPPAPQGRGRMVSFYSQQEGSLCIVASRAQAEANVIVGDCSSPGARFIVDAAAKRVRLAANPPLCLDGTVGGELRVTSRGFDARRIHLPLTAKFDPAADTA